MPQGGVREQLRGGRRATAAWLRSLPPAALWALSLALVIGVAVFDWATGFGLTFSLFYLAPVAVAAWFGGRVAGLSISALAAAEGLVLDLIGVREIPPHVHAWDAAIRLGFFAITTLLLVRLREAFTQLDELARRDSLTGLLNRRAFSEILVREVVRERRTGQGFALCVFDLDGFKQVNDRFGHAAGDAVLQAVARAMTSVAGEADVAARLGGDEFALLFLQTQPEAAFAAADALQHAVREAMAEGKWDTDLSGGVISFGTPPESAGDALERADALARRAKAEGKRRMLRAELAAPSGGDGADQRPDWNSAALMAGSSDQKT